VLGSESDRLRELRLLSLATDPDAFGSTHAYELEYPAERWTQRAADSEDGSSQRTFVAATEADEWTGMALVRGEADEPATAALFAMWVAPQARGQGVARLLCDAGAA
jgi:GNAT superfamily N-acetyltransferase